MGVGVQKSGRYSRRGILEEKGENHFKAGILTAALPDIEGLKEKMQFA